MFSWYTESHTHTHTNTNTQAVHWWWIFLCRKKNSSESRTNVSSRSSPNECESYIVTITSSCYRNNWTLNEKRRNKYNTYFHSKWPIITNWSVLLMESTHSAIHWHTRSHSLSHTNKHKHRDICTIEFHHKFVERWYISLSLSLSEWLIAIDFHIWCYTLFSLSLSLFLSLWFD